MIPFSGIDLTFSRINDIPDGDDFITATVSEVQSQSLVHAAGQAADLMEKADIPKPLRIVRVICEFVGLIIAFGIFRALLKEDSVSLSQAYQNAPWLFWVGGVCLAIWLILAAIGRKKKAEVMSSDESTYTSSNLDSISSNIFAELGVPADARDVDILSFTYKNKKGTAVAVTKGFARTPYTNYEYKIYVQDGSLCLANLEHRYEFPLSELRAIRTVKKRIAMAQWNKEMGYNDGIYSVYKITKDQYDCYYIKPYHILEFEHNGDLWGIYFPCYEKPIFEKLTGLKAEPTT